MAMIYALIMYVLLVVEASCVNKFVIVPFVVVTSTSEKTLPLPKLIDPLIVAPASVGVVILGEVAKTRAPVPVSPVTAVKKSAEEKEPNTVALPVEVIAPVRSAFVVTVEAVVARSMVMVFGMSASASALNSGAPAVVVANKAWVAVVEVAATATVPVTFGRVQVLLSVVRSAEVRVPAKRPAPPANGRRVMSSSVAVAERRIKGAVAEVAVKMF